MARSSVHIPVRMAPDFAEIARYVERVSDRFEAVRDDPRVVALRREIDAAGADDICEKTFEGGMLILEPSDKLLRLVAKMRAVERAVLS